MDFVSDEKLKKMNTTQLMGYVKTLEHRIKLGQFKKKNYNKHSMNSLWSENFDAENVKNNLKKILNLFELQTTKAKKKIIMKQHQCLVKAFGYDQQEINEKNKTYQFDIQFLYNQNVSLSTSTISQRSVFHFLINILQSFANKVFFLDTENKTKMFNEKNLYFFPSCSNNGDETQDLFTIINWKQLNIGDDESLEPANVEPDSQHPPRRKCRIISFEKQAHYLHNHTSVFYVNNIQPRDQKKIDFFFAQKELQITDNFNIALMSTYDDDNQYQFWTSESTSSDFTKYILKTEFENMTEQSERTSKFWYETEVKIIEMEGFLKTNLKQNCSTRIQKIIDAIVYDYYITQKMCENILNDWYCRNKHNFDQCMITILIFLQDQLVFKDPDYRTQLQNLALENKIYYFDFKSLKKMIELHKEIDFEDIWFEKKNP